jgi:uncharacterized DUF497 family protein
MIYNFRWNAWNSDHIARHGISEAEAEWVVCRPRAPYPQKAGAGKYLVRGPTETGAYIQVIYIFDPDDVVYVIHARPLTQREKRRYRRRR